MPQFHETGYGRTFFESRLPSLIKAINRLAKAIEKSNSYEEDKNEWEGKNE